MTTDIATIPVSDTARVAEEIERNGVVVLDGLYDEQFVCEVRSEYLDYHERLRLFLERVLPGKQTGLYGNISIRIPTRWEHLFDILPYHKPPTLSQTDLFLPKTLDNAVRSILKVDEESYYTELGGIPSGAWAAPGSWHRDSFPIFDEKTDANLPSWYLTLVIPLIDLEGEAIEGGEGVNDFGTTSFIPGSHKKTLAELDRTPWNENDYTSVLARAKLGQAVLFDGRMVHRGEANQTPHLRPFLYMVFNRTWYIDRELAFLPSLYDDGTHEDQNARDLTEVESPERLKKVQTARTWPAASVGR